MEKRPLTCPHCGAAGSVSCQGKRLALYPSVYFCFLPTVVAQVHQLQAPVDYHCGACQRDFARRTGLGKASIWILLLAILFWVGAGFYYLG
jgi:transcription elongation factor Elf1